MSKPYGMTPTFQVIVPTEVENNIWDAVRGAIDAGMTAERFRRECAQAWSEYHRDLAEDSERSWSK